MTTAWPLLLFAVSVFVLMMGFPVAFSLAGSALALAGIGSLFGRFDAAFLAALPERIHGVMMNMTLVAVPLFVFMGVMLERSRISEELLETMAQLFGGLRGGLGISVCLVGGLLAASTGIVGATVVTMGLISLPAMLKRGYSPALATGLICASGTLGQIIPPSVVLVILGDMLGSAYQQAQLELGIFTPRSVSVADLFVGAIAPGLLLVLVFALYVAILAWLKPSAAPAIPRAERGSLKDPAFRRRVIRALVFPLLMILAVLGSILGGVATPTEAASVGAVGAIVLARLRGQLSLPVLRQVMLATTEISAMVFTILVGAAVFSLVFRGFGGDEVVRDWLTQGRLAQGHWGLFAVNALIFALGFFIDFFEICFIVVPLVAPALLVQGFDPVWLGVLIGVNLQTSFLTPPFGFALFYLRGVAPPSIRTETIYRGVVPFIALQLLVLAILWIWPPLATWLPFKLFGE